MHALSGVPLKRFRSMMMAADLDRKSFLPCFCSPSDFKVFKVLFSVFVDPFQTTEQVIVTVTMVVLENLTVSNSDQLDTSCGTHAQKSTARCCPLVSLYRTTLCSTAVWNRPKHRASEQPGGRAYTSPAPASTAETDMEVVADGLSHHVHQ